ncbi:MAG: HepT-like ribonuclease domain-containing protein [Candidatus Bathyarchaeia archaeon]
MESIVSLCMHVATEAYGKTPTSYREAVRFIGERLNMPFIRELESLVGLRNLLIHRYWIVEDEKVYEALKTNFKCVEEL